MSTWQITRRQLIARGVSLGILVLRDAPTRSQRSSVAVGDRMLVSATQIDRVIEQLRRLGESIEPVAVARINALAKQATVRSAAELEGILRQWTLMRVVLDASGVGKASAGGATWELRELGWRSFLIRVENPARCIGPLTLLSHDAIAEGKVQAGIHDSHILGNDKPEVVDVPVDLDSDYGPSTAQWMGYRFGDGTTPERGLEGAPLEYQILQIYSQRGGRNSASLAAGSATVESSYRFHDCTGFSATFDCTPAQPVSVRVRDANGEGTTASLLIFDDAGRLYPAPAHRLEPDLVYQPCIYRADGESLRLPLGRYTVTARRGPEYLECHRNLDLSAGGAATLEIALERWINPPSLGWYPGDPHIHPEGQAFGFISKYGLTPETLLRQVRGEALSIGSVLIWTGGYYYEKKFLTGHVYRPTNVLPFPEAQRADNSSLVPQPVLQSQDSLVRYDVEQAAFPSNRLGHLILLRVKNHDYPGATSIYDWPSWNLPILKWARVQGAVVGYAHIGRTLDPGSEQLPNYQVPEMDDLGANECLVDVTHGVVDFVAGCKNQATVELNLWYHLLSCGFRLPLIGETDFVGWNARVGAGRTYARLTAKPIDDSGYSAWVDSIRAGSVYCGDGRSHLMDFCANGQALGTPPLNLRRSGRITLTANVAARLEPAPFNVDDALRRDNLWQYWHIERARIGSSRKVPVELIVNARVVDRREIEADGQLREMAFSATLERSSWVALRILPSSHTAPIFIHIRDEPIRASRGSAQWCLHCVNVLWDHHAKRIRDSERDAAAAAWDHARNTYRQILSESEG